MHDVSMSTAFEERFLDLGFESATAVVSLIKLFREFGLLDVVLVPDGPCRDLIWPDDVLGEPRWMAFRLYAGFERVSILAHIEKNGSTVLY